MKVSHEVPLKYLEFSKQFNDYDYALVHLFVDHPEYLEFFKNSIKQGREVLLDNSAYEITTNPELLEKYPDGYFPENLYINYIRELNPTYYVLPDVKDDYLNTIRVIENWKERYGDISSKTIGVVHGKTIKEMQDCYDYLVGNCDKIAFSFESWWFDVAKQLDMRLDHIRVYMITKLDLDKSKPHHLLGCILPSEFALWRKTNWIESIDTSAPITNAIEGKEIKRVMKDKPSTTIHGSFDLAFDQDIADRMKHNAELFKKYYVN